MISPAPRNSFRKRRVERGQTLIIALLVLGVLLILAGVFAGILNSAIRGAGFASERATISDFSEAGVRFAHGQLLNSELGADWRGTPTVLETAGDITRDPDAYYLRPPASAYLNPNTNKTDQGGPDGLGPFFRVNFDRGRALVRVRYAPGDPSIFSNERVGGLLKPGRARNYIVIESIGRNGGIIKGDPTVGGRRGAVQFRNYGSAAAFATALTRMREFDAKEQTSRKLVAFAQIGLIDTARFITDKYLTGRPAEIGAPPELGIRDENGAVRIPTVLGADTPLYSPGAGGATGALSIARYPGSGSLHSNADLKMYGDITAKLNPDFGDAWTVAGNILPVDATTRFHARLTTSTGTAWTPDSRDEVNPNSFSGNFFTLGGILRDGNPGPDALGFSRGIGRKAPPTILAPSAEGAVSRYVSATRDTGIAGANGTSGQYGHGAGVYVDNASDFQTSADEQSRQIAGTSQGLVQDWLSPFGDGVTFRSGWRGPFYIPVGAYVRLLSDGFVIARNSNPDQRPQERTWRTVNGQDSNLSSIRYKIGMGNEVSGPQIHIVNTLTPNVSIDADLSPADYMNGPIFNGILYFEGNVRLRGQIPTDVPLTIVTNRTAYIEGNIIKGTVGNDVTSQYPLNAVARTARLPRRSRSALMIMARDYVALNTTMFFGPASETNVSAERGGQGIGGYSPVRVAAPDGDVTLQVELPMRDTPSAARPGIDPNRPNTWAPLALDYRSFTTLAADNGEFLSTKLLLSHTLESTASGPANVFLAMGVNEGRSAQTSYLFDLADSRTNSARVQYAEINVPNPPPATAPVYGLGLESWQQSAKFETIGFPILDRTATEDATRALYTVNTAQGQNRGGYTLSALDTNNLRIDLTNLASEPSGNYLVGRAAATPSDIRIEASIYAEDGSFFVIPGDWFNPNTNDVRSEWIADRNRFTAGGANLLAATRLADEERLTTFGATADAPFYGEPLDVKVTVIGSVSENMPPPIAQQSEWLKRWGWIPFRSGSQSGKDLATPTGDPILIPTDHAADAVANNTTGYAPNLTIQYDPMLATGRVAGYALDAPGLTDLNGINSPVRFQISNGQIQPLPPMPRLPVSPTLAYFGEAK